MQTAYVELPDGRLEASGNIPDDVELVPIDLPTVSADEAVQARYVTMRLDGQSHSMAEMLATRRFPGLRTDSEFNKGRVNGNQFEACPARGDWLRRQAELAGVSTTGKTYLSQLADFPGDPRAWVSDRGDVERIVREKGYGCSGAVNVAREERPPIAPVEVAPEIIESEVDSILEANPGASREDVREEVYQLRTGQADPNPLLVSDCHEDVQ